MPVQAVNWFLLNCFISIPWYILPVPSGHRESQGHECNSPGLPPGQHHTSYRSTTLLPGNPETKFHVTHPYSPFKGETFLLIKRTECWGADRVLCFDKNGCYRRFFTCWTDLDIPDAFRQTSEGRAFLSADSMISLGEFLNMIANDLST